MSEQPILQESKEYHQSALDVFPGGVSHNIRHFDPHPIYLEKAKDSRVWDVDGNVYIDFWMNHMASVLGHAHPDVVEALDAQMRDGFHYGAPTEAALELGEKVQKYVSSAERVRFCCSGTEATMYATRLARAATDRDHVLKAQGGWHGGNSSLSSAIHEPFPEPQTAGLPTGLADYTHSFPLNDEATVDEILAEYEGDVAAIIVEPMLLAGGGVSARDSFLKFLRKRCDERGIVLVFDEVVTGFRFSPGSYQSYLGITPDLTTLGKALGGGLPVGAIAGRAEYFEAARPDVEIPPDQSVIGGGGTFSMNPMTATAGLATIEVLESEPVYEYTESRAQQVRNGLQDVFTELGIEVSVLGKSSLFLTHFEPKCQLDTVADVETATNREALVEYHSRLRDHGYYFLPGHMGSVSYQTKDAQLDGLLQAARDVGQDLIDEGFVEAP